MSRTGACDAPAKPGKVPRRGGRVGSSAEASHLELGHMIMCRMTCVSGNLQRAGVTGHTLTRTVSDLLRSRRPFRFRDGGNYGTCR